MAKIKDPSDPTRLEIATDILAAMIARGGYPPKVTASELDKHFKGDIDIARIDKYTKRSQMALDQADILIKMESLS